MRIEFASRAASILKRATASSVEGHVDSGAPSGMPLFLQKSPHGTLQRCGLTPCDCSHDQGQVPAVVGEALRSPGERLDAGTRGVFEPAFGREFSDVRVHTGERAERAAEAVNATAFTVGNSIVFGRGMYQPRASAGRRLIAHELAHTVQQGGDMRAASTVGASHTPAEREADAIAEAVVDGRADAVRRSETAGVVQRDDKPTAARIDVAIVLSDDEQDMSEGHAYAGTVLRVFSADDARDKLKALGKPIGTLYVVSHSNAEGKVKFVSSIGTISWVPISSLGATLKKGFAGGTEPQTVDFQGCKVGSAGPELESFRSALGAQSAQGSTCWSFSQRVTPLTYDGADITNPSQIPKGQEKRFDQALLTQINGLKSEDGHPVKDCIIGLGAGEHADAANLKKIWSLYWANNGNLIATWNSPEYNEKWQQGSICWKDMTESTTPCGLVKKTAPSPSGATPSP